MHHLIVVSVVWGSCGCITCFCWILASGNVSSAILVESPALVLLCQRRAFFPPLEGCLHPSDADHPRRYASQYIERGFLFRRDDVSSTERQPPCDHRRRRPQFIRSRGAEEAAESELLLFTCTRRPSSQQLRSDAKVVFGVKRHGSWSRGTKVSSGISVEIPIGVLHESTSKSRLTWKIQVLCFGDSWQRLARQTTQQRLANAAVQQRSLSSWLGLLLQSLSNYQLTLLGFTIDLYI